jgi:hypothetical protein
MYLQKEIKKIEKKIIFYWRLEFTIHILFLAGFLIPHFPFAAVDLPLVWERTTLAQSPWLLVQGWPRASIIDYIMLWIRICIGLALLNPDPNCECGSESEYRSKKMDQNLQINLVSSLSEYKSAWVSLVWLPGSGSALR